MVGAAVRLFAAALLMLCAYSDARAAIDVRVNRTELSVDESFTAVFETDSSRAADPDFSVLERDFEVLSSRRRSNYSLVNGRMTGSTAWELELMARAAGTFELPPVRFGNETSKPLTITVTPRTAADDDDGPLLLELEVSDRNPYVQAEVICTLRMYFDIASSERRLSEPALQGIDAVVKRLGDDRSYFATRSQRRYEVIERRYGIYPQASGSLDLDAFSLQARILDNQRSFLARTGTMHRVQSEPVAIEVRPVPDGFPGATWLPARNLDIEQRLDAPSPLHAGEPISVTFELRAEGLNASQLPDPVIAWPEGLRVYPEAPTSDEVSDLQGTRATRRLSMALIASEAGEYSVPAIRIPWWNTKTDRLEFAELPPRDLSVLPRPEATGPPSPTTVDTQIAARAGNNAAYWRYASLILGSGWLLTLVLWWLRQNRSDTARTPTRTDRAKTSAADTFRELRRACDRGDAAATRARLIDLCQSHWPGETGLARLRASADTALAQELDRLDRHLYRDTDSAWNGNALVDLVKQAFDNPGRPAAAARGELAPLHLLR